MLNFPLKNSYFKYFHNSKGLRDNFFTSLLGAYYNKSINVLELGTSRDIRNDARNGDGWSTLWWITHVLCFGGHITTVDLSAESIENCKKLTQGYEEYIDYYVDNGERYLESDKFDIIFLDGSDDPNDMLRQFEICMDFDSAIIMDDFNSKGVLVWEKYKDRVKLFNCNGTHLMGFYKKS